MDNATVETGTSSEPVKRRKRASGGTRTRKPISVFVFFKLENADGGQVEVPAGTTLVVEEVTRDVIAGYRSAMKGSRLYADLQIPVLSKDGDE